MNKMQRKAKLYEQQAKYKKIRNSIDFSMNFLQTYLDNVKVPEDETSQLYINEIKEAISDLDEARQLYSYLIGDKQ